MALQFNFPVTNTVNNIVNVETLRSEINANPNILIGLSDVGSIFDSQNAEFIVVTFKTDLSTPEEGVLAGIIAAHNGFVIIEDVDLIRVAKNDTKQQANIINDNDRIKVEVTGTLSDGTVKVSANDASMGPLIEKIVPADNKVVVSETNDGNAEQLTIGINPSNILTSELDNDAEFLDESAHDNLAQDNPHNVTKAQVGLGNADNTSDANKPISNATQTALNDIAQDVTNLENAAITDHGELGGLQDDDHLQYLNEGRHDGLPNDNPHTVTLTQAVQADVNTDVTASELETLTDGSNANGLHQHPIGDIIDFAQGVIDNAPVQVSDIADFETTTQLNNRDVANRNRANHQGSQPASTISDFASQVVANQTVTNLVFNNTTKILSYTNELGNTVNVDLTQFLDDTNLARILNGTLNAATGIATFTRDDGSTFTVDFSSLNDQAAIGAAIAAHEAASDPHPQYTTAAEATALAPVQPADIQDFETTTQLNARDVANRNRANHQGSQLASTISNFNTAASAAAPVQNVNGETGTVSLGQNNLNDTIITSPLLDQILQYNGVNWVNVFPVSKNELIITQPNHGFTLTNGIPKPAYSNTSGLVQLAQANSLQTLSAYYITEIINANQIRIQSGGSFINAVSHGLSVGRYYFTSELVAGEISITEPLSTINDVVLFAVDADNLLLIDNRPEDKNSIEKFLIKVRNTNTTTNINTVAPTAIPVTGTVEQNENNFYTVVGNGIQVPQTRSYKVKANIHVGSVSTRSSARIRFAINGSPQGDIAATGYIRNSTGHNEASYIISDEFILNANDIVTVTAERESTAGGTVTLQEVGTSSITVEAR
jgi:hypothetical protein